MANQKNDLTDTRGWTIPARYGGEDYGDIDLGDFNVHEARLFTEQTGVDLFRCVTRGRFAFDEIATLVWLCERRTQPDLSIDDVFGKMKVQDMIDVAVAAYEGNDDDPKPQKGRKAEAAALAEQQQEESLGKAGGGDTAT